MDGQMDGWTNRWTNGWTMFHLNKDASVNDDFLTDFAFLTNALPTD